MDKNMSFSADATKDLERKARDRKMYDTGFSDWKNQQTTRLIISTLPAMENPESLDVLLRSAFDAGTSSGSGSMALTFLEAVLAKESKPPR